MLAVIHSNEVAYDNHDGPPETYAESEAILSMHSFSKRNKAYHTRFKKNTGTKRWEDIVFGKKVRVLWTDQKLQFIVSHYSAALFLI